MKNNLTSNCKENKLEIEFFPTFLFFSTLFELKISLSKPIIVFNQNEAQFI
jgi:flagellar biosynthesis component FlhA